MSDFRYFILKTFNLFSNGTICARNAMTKEQYERRAPRIDPALVNEKSAALLRPSRVPEFYMQAADYRKKDILIGNHHYRPERFIDDPKTGLRASVYAAEDGSKILLFNGVAKPWKSDSTPYERPNEFKRGLNDITAAADGLYGPQLRAALKLYENVLKDPTTKHVQVVGYSLGSLYANEISARFSQNSLTFANLGTHPGLAGPIRVAAMQKHVTDIQLKGDLFAGLVGPVHTDKRNITKSGLSTGHTPADYALHANSKAISAAQSLRAAREKANFAMGSVPVG